MSQVDSPTISGLTSLPASGSVLNGDYSSTPARIEYERMLDDKGRVTIPPRVRLALGTDFVTTRGAAGSVLVIPAALWPDIERTLNAEATEGDRYHQFAIHNHTQTSLDRQGRLKLPKHLLEWASLTPGDAAAIVANGAGFEVWNRRAWTRRLKPIHDSPGDGSLDSSRKCDSPGDSEESNG